MTPKALTDLRTWTPVGMTTGWRRRTGIPRAHLEALPLFFHVHPEDVVPLLALGELLDYRAAEARVRLGQFGQWTSVTLRGERRAGDLAVLEVDARELPRPLWWSPTDLWLPPEPRPMHVA